MQQSTPQPTASATARKERRLRRVRSSGNSSPRSASAESLEHSPPPEPDPVVWTLDYTRRITPADVIAICGSLPSHGKQDAFERTRDALARRTLQFPWRTSSSIEIERLSFARFLTGEI